MSNATTYELRVIDLDGLWFFVILRNGREPVEVSKPYGPVMTMPSPSRASRTCEAEGRDRLAVWIKMHETLAKEDAQRLWDHMPGVAKGGDKP